MVWDGPNALRLRRRPAIIAIVAGVAAAGLIITFYPNHNGPNDSVGAPPPRTTAPGTTVEATPTRSETTFSSSGSSSPGSGQVEIRSSGILQLDVGQMANLDAQSSADWLTAGPLWDIQYAGGTSLLLGPHSLASSQVIRPSYQTCAEATNYVPNEIPITSQGFCVVTKERRVAVLFPEGLLSRFDITVYDPPIG